jgi:two-component system invasion response regulator UvrY
VSRRQIRVLVVDDQPPFLRAARAVLEAASGFDLIAEVTSGEEAVAAARELEPDLVLMDVNMPGIGGVEATRRIVTARPETIVVLLSSYEDAPADTDRSGAAVYVPKGDFGPGVLEDVWLTHLRPDTGAPPSPSG